MKKEFYELYNHDDIPKIKNFFVYHLCCLIKVLSIVFFGVGALFLALFAFPVIRLFNLKKDEFGIVARSYISHTFRNFLGFFDFLGISKLNVEDKQAYKNIHSKIIVANHPSLIDFVYIMSLVPNSTCIVRGGLTKTPLAGVIKQAYITNTSNFDDICDECKKLTDKGCNVIIFPAGTRTPRHGYVKYKKGAARIALYTGCDILPLFIGGSDKYGLGKHDPLWSYNHVERYYFDFKILPEIPIADYKTLPEAIAAKHLTDKMEEVIKAAGDEFKKTWTGKTINNY